MNQIKNEEIEYTEIIDDDEDLDISEQATTPQAIYDELLKHSPIIVSIPADQLSILKKSVSGVKYNLNQKAIKMELPTDDRRIIFERIDGDTDGVIRVRISFKVGSINVFSIEKERI